MASRTLRLRAKSAFLSATLATSVLVPLSGAPAAAATTNGSIDGVVTGPGGASGDDKGLSNICVDVFNSSGGWAGSDRTSTGSVSSPEGYWFVDGLSAGNYRVRFRDCGNQSPNEDPLGIFDGDLATQWSGAKNSFGAATIVSIDGDDAGSGPEDEYDQTNPIFFPGADRSTDIRLELEWATAAGTLTDDPQGFPLGGVCVQAYGVTGNLIAETATTSAATNDGAFSLSQLPPDTYRFQFRDDVANCGSVTRPGGTGTGNADPANPAQGSRAVASGADRYLTEFWNDKPSLALADTVVIPAGGGSYTNIDGALFARNLNQGISGTVTSTAGGGAAGVCISVYQEQSGSSRLVDVSPQTPVTTNATGQYTVALNPGAYFVEVHERCTGPVPPVPSDDTFVARVHPSTDYSDDKATPSRRVDLDTLVVPPASAKVTVVSGSFTSIGTSVNERGSITGRITDESDSSNVGGVCVVAFDGPLAATSPAPNVASANDGTYAIGALRPGGYNVEFRPADTTTGSCAGGTAEPYFSEWFNGVNSKAQATTVTVPNRTAAANVNASLRPTSDVHAIAGRVTQDGATSQGILNVCVSVRDLDNSGVASALTTSDGTYRVEQVPSGTYRVRFSRPDAPDCSGPASNPGDAAYIATEFHNNQTRFANATNVTVADDDVTVDAQVGPGSRVTGAVTYAATPRPICVEVLDGSQNVVGATATSSTYRVDGVAAGTYRMRFDDKSPSGTCAVTLPPAAGGAPDYQTEYYLNKRTFADATPFTLQVSATATGIDALMDVATVGGSGFGSLSGYVKEPDTGGSDTSEPLNGIVVEVFRFDQDPGVDQPAFSATTKQRTQTVTVTQCPESAESDLSSTPECETGDPTNEPCLDSPPNNNFPRCQYETVPAETVQKDIVTQGHWIINASTQQGTALTPGSYKVRFRDPLGLYATEWHRGRPTFDSALSVRLDAGAHVEIGELAADEDNYDADTRTSPAGDNTDPEPGKGNGSTELTTVLATAGNVTGRVTRDGTPTAVANVRVDLLREDTGATAATAFTGSNGTYQVPGVAPGGYKVHFTPTSDPTLGDEFFDNQSTFGEAQVVTVAASSTRSGIDAALPSNSAPVAGDDARQIEINTSTVLADLLSNDVDPDGDALTIIAVGTPSHGTAVLNEANTVTVTPQENNQDDLVFTYTVEDPSGLTATATVTAEVVGEIVGVPPTARDDEASTPLNTAITIAVLANDTDPDGDDGALVLSSVGTPFHGTASIQGRSILYTPTSGFAGLDQFSYDVTDEQGFTSSAKVTVAVNASGLTSASRNVGAGGTASTEGSSATPSNPIITSVTTPNAGTVTIKEEQVAAGKVSDISTLTWRSVITAPNATASNPLTITFRLDGSLLGDAAQPDRAIRVLRNNALVGDCLGSSTASPDPCISGHRMIGDDLFVTIKTSAASTWTFGFDNDAVVDRASGASGTGRVGTAVAVSRNAFDPADVTTVVIARKDAYPDALAGAPLAHQLGAPMLLTTKDTLDAITREEIVRLGASRVVILGGTAAVSSGVETSLRGIPGVTQVDRIRGADRFATAAAVAQQLGSYDLAYVVEGADANLSRGWPDAVAVASLAAFEGRPILLVTTEELPTATRNALSGLREAVIIGGTASVSSDVANAIDGVVGAVGRVRGTDRYETSFAVAQRAVNAGMSASSVWVATGQNFPDALAAGPAVAKEGGILLLVNGTNYDASPAVERFLTANRTKVETLTVVGGTAVISVGSEVRMAQATTN